MRRTLPLFRPGLNRRFEGRNSVETHAAVARGASVEVGLSRTTKASKVAFPVECSQETGCNRIGGSDVGVFGRRRFPLRIATPEAIHPSDTVMSRRGLTTCEAGTPAYSCRRFI